MDAIDGMVDTIKELEAELKQKDFEIVELKEQVASLQRVIRQHRDSDSQVDA